MSQSIRPPSNTPSAKPVAGHAAPSLLGAFMLLVAIGIPMNQATGGDWPGWRGVHRDGHLQGESLPSQFPVPPPVAWRKSIGHGYASPSIAAEKLVYLDDTGGKETAHCVDAKSGAPLWSTPYHENYSDEFEPGPRCTPLIDGDRVYVQSCRGEFRCLSLKDGSTLWRFHFSDYGATWVTEKGSPIGAASRRGHSGSPVVLGDRIFVQIGSTNGASIAAFDKRSGKLAWKSQNDLTCYSSMAWGSLAGKLQVVSATCEGLLGLAADSGALLWRVPFKTGANRNVLTPLIDGDSITFASYTTGLRRVRIQANASSMEAQEEWLNRDLKINLSTPTLVGNAFYGLGPDTQKAYLCVDRDSGKVLWSQPGFNAVASTLTDGQRLLVLNDQGECILLAADPAAYHELGRFQACGKTYSHPAIANGILYLRDSRELIAYSLPTSPR